MAKARKKSSSGKEKVSTLDRLALWITEHVGTMPFFVMVFLWTFGWLSWNMVAPRGLRFDPFPGFVLWLFLSNMIQLFLMPLIMIGQNLQNRDADLRAESDYEINCKAEMEVQEIKARLECIMKHLGVETSAKAKKIEAKVKEQPDPAPVEKKQETH